MNAETGANHAVEFTAVAILKCNFDSDPDFESVVLLMGFEGADGSQGAPGLTDESSFAHGTASVTSTRNLGFVRRSHHANRLWRLAISRRV
jgi:hypothetical protein